MAIRIKWDKYETALLIEGFWRIEKSPENKKEIIAELSGTLRTRAVNLGIEIDEVFRNANGISMQLSAISHAFFPERSSLTASAMFKNMVNLYKTNRESFDEILCIAKNQVGESVEMNDSFDKKDLFITWLSSNCPNDLHSQDVEKALEEGSQRSIKLQYSEKSFWEMSSIEEYSKATEKLLATLKGSRFQISRKRSLAILEKSIDIYKQFLTERTTIQKTQNMLPAKSADKKKAFPAIDRTEAVYLIDKYLDIIAHKNDRALTVKETSSIFRSRALRFDMDIDEAFRNMSFVDECFSDIAQLFQNPDNENCHPLIRELVSLYLRDPDRYNLQSMIVHEELSKLGLVSSEESDITTSIQGNSEEHSKIRSVTTPSDSVDSESASEKEAHCTISVNNAKYMQDIELNTPSKDDTKDVRNFYEGKQIMAAEQAKKAPTKDSTKQTDASHRQNSKATERRYSRDDKEAFYRWMKEDQNIAEASCVKYVSAIRGAESYASSYISPSCKLFCDSKEIIEFTARALFNDVPFIKKNEQQHDRLFAAIRNYLKYKHISANTSEVEQTVIEPVIEEHKTINKSVISILRKHFVYGFNISSAIEIMRFRAYYETDYDEQCTFDDEVLRTAIAECGLSYRGKIFVIEQDMDDRVRTLVSERVQAGEFIFYFDEIYSINEEWLYDGHIFDSDMLKVLIQKIFPKYQYKDRYFIARNARMTEINALKEAILHSWGNHILHTFGELKELLPFIPLDKIRYVLSYSKEFTWNSIETYARNDMFEVSDEQIREVLRTVNEKCTKKGSITFDELPLEDIAAENYELSETALFEIIFSYLPNSFSRNGRVISRTIDQQYDTIAAIQHYCKSHETCTMTELRQVMQNIEGTVRYPVIIEAANAVMVRVSENDFVTDDNVFFDVPVIDNALDNVVVGDGIGIKEVTTFGAFPFCGYSWNHFILESYCRRFSYKYKYACITPNSQNAGAIIRKASNLSYLDIMAEALSRIDMQLNEKNAFDYLIASGFLIRRRYSDMDALLQKASALKKGDD